MIPRDRIIPGRRRPYDVAGAFTITAARLLLVRTVVEAPEGRLERPRDARRLRPRRRPGGRLRDHRAAQPQPLVRLGILRSGPLVDRSGTTRLIAAGMVAFVVDYALFLRIDDSPSFAGLMLPTMLLIGAGFALCFSSQSIQAVAGVPDHEQGLAFGLVNSSFQLGGPSACWRRRSA